MSKEHIVHYKKGMKSRTDWQRISAMTDADIDYSDIPKTDVNYWAKAEVILPKQKIHVGMRFDPEVIAWFKKQGPRYQSRINAVLKMYIAAQEQKESQNFR